MINKLVVPAETGIAAIDNQHTYYYKLINDFVFLSKNRHVEKAEAVTFFADVVDYTVDHFDSEEFFMRSIEYPYYEEHLEEHNKFRDQIEKMSAELATATNICKFAENSPNWSKHGFRLTLLLPI
ncbi:MAG: bacteriohemerythrin [Victivallaceae bacterium]